jgi:hypothetical protein
MMPSMGANTPNPVGPTGGSPGPNDPQKMIEQIMAQIPPEVMQQLQQMPPDKIMMIISQLLTQSGIPQDMAVYMAKAITQRILDGQQVQPAAAPQGPSLANQGV